LRRYAVVHSLFPQTTLKRAIDRLGFVQADPIRAPARAQDLTLRHRVKNYRAGDLERRYAALGVEEDTFINYGFVSSSVYALMHPRRFTPDWPAAQRKRVQALMAVVRARLLTRHGDQLLGRLVERDNSSDGRHALPRSAPRGAPRRRHQDLRGSRARADADRRSDKP
jgi:hypothetical protein